jgi:twitching motility protein PilT
MEETSNLLTVLLELLNGDKQFSDVRVEPNTPIMIKTASGWEDAHVFDVPTMDDISVFLKDIDENYQETLLSGLSVNKPLNLNAWRLRINAYLASGGEKLMLSIRKIPINVPSIQETGLPAATRLILENASGLILISGPTGAGKTTSMAAMVNEINATRNAHILSIEDPIEYVHKPNLSIFSQREIGVDCKSFYVGVKDALRQKPDVIIIGEIRDKETAEQALIAGESGHLVIGTLHASSAVGTINKLLGFFNADERESKLQSLSSSLVAIFNQTLIPKKSGVEFALAVDFLANHNRTYSRILGEPDKVTSKMDNKESDDASVPLVVSITKLINEGVVDKGQAAKCVSGNATVYEKIRKL